MTNRENQAQSPGRFAAWDTLAFASPPRDAFEALRALEQVSHHLRQRADSRAIFPDVYGIITENVVGELVEPRGLFWEPAFIRRLAGCFAERYLDTLRWSMQGQPQDCQAWALAYAHADDPSFTPLQHATLGISAHINYDLSLGIYRTLVELGASRNTRLIRRMKHDHDQVNILLEESYWPAVCRLVKVYGCRASGLLSRVARPWSTRVTMNTLSAWRERVWDNVIALLNCRGENERAQVIRRIDRHAGLTARLLSANSFGLLGRLRELPTSLLVRTAGML